MGGGAWTHDSYVSHSTTTRGFASMDSFKSASTSQLYTQRRLDECLNPYGVIRECCDSDEHPNTIPVILALDVTGSMGDAASAIATQLGDIMSELYKQFKDIEFMTMAIGDLSYDDSPIQASQFESDIRIADQLSKIYFEGRGGGNSWESYTSAWYFGLRHTKLDCWKRNRKGIIITLGDEMLNPYLPQSPLTRVLGDPLQGDVDTTELYAEACKKFDIYHIAVNDSRTAYSYYADRIKESFGNLLKDNLKISDCNRLGQTISEIISESLNGVSTMASDSTDVNSGSDTLICW